MKKSEAKTPFWRRNLLRGSGRRLKFAREGKYFVGIAVGVGFAAINTGNNLLYLLLGWMLSVIIASGIMSEQTLRKLRVRRVPPPRIQAGRPFLMGVTVQNNKKRLPSFSVEVEDVVGTKPLDKKCFFLKVPAGRTQSTSYRHTFARRGRYVLEGFRVSTKFPFALFRKSRLVGDESEVIVYPATHPVRIPLPKAAHGGAETRARIGRHGEFFGLREYREGDDRRDVHWRSSARHGRLLVREYEDEVHRRATLMVDNSLPKDATPEQLEELERAISLTASLAVSYIEHRYAIRLIARGAQLPFESGPPHLARILRLLALLDTVDDGVAFSGAADPRSDVTFVARKGGVPSRLPAGVGRVMEA